MRGVEVKGKRLKRRIEMKMECKIQCTETATITSQQNQVDDT